MKVTVNGEPLEIEKPLSVKEFLVVAKAEQPEYVTVQLNGEFVDLKRRRCRTAIRSSSCTSWEAVRSEQAHE